MGHILIHNHSAPPHEQRMDMPMPTIVLIQSHLHFKGGCQNTVPAALGRVRHHQTGWAAGAVAGFGINVPRRVRLLRTASCAAQRLRRMVLRFEPGNHVHSSSNFDLI